MKTGWTYEEVNQLYNELLTDNPEDQNSMWQPTSKRKQLYLKLPIYTNLDWEVMEKYSSFIMIGTENKEAVAIMWAKKEKGERNI